MNPSLIPGILYITSADDYSLSFEGYLNESPKIYPRRLKARKDAQGRVWIVNTDTGKNVLNAADPAKINLGGTVYDAYDFTVTFNGLFGVILTTTTTTESFVCNNILLNGGFENWTDGLADNWSPGGVQEIETVHSGASSIRVNYGDGGEVLQTFISTSTCLTARFWYNTTTADIVTLIIIRLNGESTEFLQADLTWGEAPLPFIYPTTGAIWTREEIAFETIDSVPHQIYIGVSGEGYAFFDDVEMCDACEEINLDNALLTEDGLFAIMSEDGQYLLIPEDTE